MEINQPTTVGGNEAFSYREYLTPIMITAGLLLASFLLHKFCESTMTQTHDMWQYRLHVHLEGYPFSIRHFTSKPIEFLNQYCGMSIRDAFFSLQFFLALLLGPCFYGFLKKLKFTRSEANIGVVILFTAYPIMSAHFEPVFTWDDFWSNLFTVISFSLVLSRRFVYSGIFFALSAFAREQTVILFPAYAAAVVLFSSGEKWSRKISYIVFPILIWGAYYFNVIQKGDPNRLRYIEFNFESFVWGRDSIFSLFISFGFMWVASFIVWFRFIDRERNPIVDFLFWGFFLVVPVNTVFTLWMTFARETRIFFPPFVFIIPLSLLMVKSAVQYWRSFSVRSIKVLSPIAVAISMFIGYLLVVKIIFPEFRYRQCWNYSQIWAGINLALGMISILLYIFSGKFRSILAQIENKFMAKAPIEN